MRFSGNGEEYPERDASVIDELLDRAVAASNRGDRVTATALAGQVLAVEGENADAEDLLAAPPDGGEIRRLTILFVDLVDSTVLSTRVEPETYRVLVGRYRDLVMEIVARFEGHVGSTKGDGEVSGPGGFCGSRTRRGSSCEGTGRYADAGAAEHTTFCWEKR